MSDTVANARLIDAEESPPSDGCSLTMAQRRQSLKAAAAGNVLEWYDWTIYSTLSIYLAANFFEKADPTSALLSTLAIFAGGFVARPLGGWFFGRIADRRGRKFTLVVTMTLLALASLGIALLPTYETAGAFASFALLVMRILQGFAHGGESGVSYVYVAEIAPRDRRGLWTSSVYVSVILGIMIATAVAAGLTSVFTADVMNEWGWRIGFGAGSVLGLYVMYLRKSAHETEVFNAADAGKLAPASDAPGKPVSIGRIIMTVMVINAAMNVWYYTWVAFAPAMAITQHGMDPNSAFLSSLGAQACMIAFLPVFGWVSDKLGRRINSMTFAALVVLCGLPIQALLSSEPSSLFIAQSLGLFIYAIGVGHYPALMAELVPARMRGMGVSVMTSLAAGLFGGTAPYLNSWLHSIGEAWVFSGYVIALNVIMFVVVFFMRETKGIDLRH